MSQDLVRKDVYKGKTDGVAVPAGNIGEIVLSVVTNATRAASSGFASTTYRTITLNKGTYALSGYINFSGFTGAAGRTIGDLVTGVNTPTIYGGQHVTMYDAVTSGQALVLHGFVMVTTDGSTVLLKASVDNSSMSGTCTFGGDFVAARIA